MVAPTPPSLLVCIEDEFALYAPNAFTPDGDGINDAWLPVTTVYFPLEYELLVFDRWGAEVFATADRYKPWDGKVNGSEAPIGVYAWTLRMRDAINERHQAQGHVAVIR
jgi:gliding motility-associated-like protein